MVLLCYEFIWKKNHIKCLQYGDLVLLLVLLSCPTMSSGYGAHRALKSDVNKIFLCIFCSFFLKHAFPNVSQNVTRWIWVWFFLLPTIYCRVRYLFKCARGSKSKKIHIFPVAFHRVFGIYMELTVTLNEVNSSSVKWVIWWFVVYTATQWAILPTASPACAARSSFHWILENFWCSSEQRIQESISNACMPSTRV